MWHLGLRQGFWTTAFQTKRDRWEWNRDTIFAILKESNDIGCSRPDWSFTFVPSAGNVHADIDTPVAFSESPRLLFPLYYLSGGFS